MRLVHSVQYSNFLKMAMGDARANATAQMTGTQAKMTLIPGAPLWGKTISCRRSNAIAVMLRVDTKIEVPWRRPPTGQAAG